MDGRRIVSQVGRAIRALDAVVSPIHSIFIVLSITSASIAAVWLSFDRLIGLNDRLYERLTGIDIPYPVIPDEVRVVLSVIIGGLLGALLSSWRFARLKKKGRRIIRVIAHCVEVHLARYNAIYDIAASDRMSVDEKKRIIAQLVFEHLVFLCSQVSGIFESITRCHCHTIIKTFDPGTGLVTTRARDALVHNYERRGAEEELPSFLFNDNTATLRILTDTKCDMYVSNGLWFLSKVGKYKNPNPSWHHRYNATAVVPLTRKTSSPEINRVSVVGFLCVDNVCGRFRRKVVRTLLGPFAVLVLDMLLTFGKENLADPRRVR